MSLRSEVLTCTRCQLRPGARAPVPPAGYLQDIVFVGEAPGENEDLQGIPFVGASGRLLRRLIADSTFITEPYFTNTVMCRPPQNSDPPAWARAACRPLLLRSIAGAKVVVTLGAVALSAFSPDAKVSKVRGQPFRWGPFVILPTWHPAAALRNPELADWIALDLAMAYGLSHHPEEWPAHPDIQYTIFP